MTPLSYLIPHCFEPVSKMTATETFIAKKYQHGELMYFGGHSGINITGGSERHKSI